ncbi:MAG: hypothetical protein II845_09950 [Oscillospiraceae bacterium]|nr:hypothetical protein [Oscillospiraceae bacterium]
MLDEDGKPKVFYHGTDEQFTTFDITKGRANMDIQGMFLSPSEEEAAEYGEHVGAYYLNLSNPAPQNVAWEAFNRFKGQNNAGIKAREYLEEQGYDGVNNSDEEIIAFKPEQIKSVTDNIGTFDRNNPNTRYSARENTLAEQNASAYNGRDPKLNRAVELVRSGAQPSTIYNETGYVRMANGNLIDPDTGEIVWRYHNDISESSDEFSAGREEGREPETGVPGNDRRGLRGLDGETIPEGTGSGKKTGRAWRSVEAAVRKNITDTITRFASEHSRKELRIFRGAVAESKFVCLKSKTNDDKIDAVNDNV